MVNTYIHTYIQLEWDENARKSAVYINIQQIPDTQHQSHVRKQPLISTFISNSLITWAGNVMCAGMAPKVASLAHLPQSDVVNVRGYGAQTGP